MQIFRDLLEPEELSILEKRTGPIKKSDEFIWLNKNDEIILEQLFLEAPPNFALAAGDRSTLIRASSVILALMTKTETVGDVASILSACISLFNMDRDIGRRLINMVRLTPTRERPPYL